MTIVYPPRPSACTIGGNKGLHDAQQWANDAAELHHPQPSTYAVMRAVRCCSKQGFDMFMLTLCKNLNRLWASPTTDDSSTRDMNIFISNWLQHQNMLFMFALFFSSRVQNHTNGSSFVWPVFGCGVYGKLQLHGRILQPEFIYKQYLMLNYVGKSKYCH